MPQRYCTVEDVRGALEEQASAYDLAAILRAIDAASAECDDAAQLAPGSFRPRAATLLFRPLPTHRRDGIPLRLYLDAHRLISLEQLTSDGEDATADTVPQPSEYGPPYSWLDLDGAGRADPITVRGLWGHGDDRESAGTLASLLDASSAVLVCSDASLIGIGDQLVIDSERLEVTGRAWTTVASAPTAALAASVAARSLPVADATKYRAGETLMIDAEQVLVTDIAGSALAVLRAQNGTVLAEHTTSSPIYAQRLLAVTRAAGGSTAASHASGATIQRHLVPPAVRSLAVASAVSRLLAERRGYATQAGPNTESGPKMSPSSLADRHEQVSALYGRPVRMRAV